MLRSRLKQGLKKGLKKVLKVDISGPPPDYGDLAPQYRGSTSAPPVPEASPPPVSAAPSEEEAPAVDETAVDETAVDETAVDESAVEEAPVEAAAEAPVEAAAEEPPAEESPAEEAPGMAADDDTAGEPLTMEAVQEILDDMVRPALQGDGGDISLIKIEDNDIYVKLVGACSTCPSSIMTMKMGVEALLKEEFPQMKDLIQIEE